MGDDDLTYVVISVEDNAITGAELLDEAPTYSGVNVPTGVTQYVRAGYINGGDTSHERTIVGLGQPTVRRVSRSRELEREREEEIERLQEQAARDLHAALARIGIESQVHWDRSPWGVRIGLVEGEFDEYEQPSLFALYESNIEIGGRWGKQWDLAIAQFGTDEYLEFTEIQSHILQRPDETYDIVADRIAAYLRLLKLGAAATNQQIKDEE